jgi:hypothetical protein
MGRDTEAPRRGRKAAARAALLMLALPLFAQSPPGDYADEEALPPGKRGDRIQQVLAALDSGEPAAIEALVKDAFTPSFRDQVSLADHLSALLFFHDQSGGFELHGVRRYPGGVEADREVVIARGRMSGAWAGITIQFDSTPEERIAGLHVSPARPPKDVPPLPPLSPEQAKEELAAFLDRVEAAQVFSGTVLLAKDGQVLFTAARGLADRDHAVPMRLDSKLNLGSMNKMFTAVVIAQLVEEGKLSYRDSVAKYLGGQGWTSADLSRVRVEHLLTHTSGLGEEHHRHHLPALRGDGLQAGVCGGPGGLVRLPFLADLPTSTSLTPRENAC